MYTFSLAAERLSTLFRTGIVQSVQGVTWVEFHLMSRPGLLLVLEVAHQPAQSRTLVSISKEIGLYAEHFTIVVGSTACAPPQIG